MRVVVPSDRRIGCMYHQTYLLLWLEWLTVFPDVQTGDYFHGILRSLKLI